MNTSAENFESVDMENQFADFLSLKTHENGLRRLFEADAGEWKPLKTLKPDCDRDDLRVCWLKQAVAYQLPIVVMSSPTDGDVLTARYNVQRLMRSERNA